MMLEIKGSRRCKAEAEGRGATFANGQLNPNSPFVFPYISYRSSGEKLLKYQQNLT